MGIFSLKTVLLLVFAVLLLHGCGTSRPTKYYLLSPVSVVGQTHPLEQNLVVGVGPIILPEYLDRRQIVTRSKANELDVAVYHQWGEPLVQNFSRVIRENLAVMVPTDRIVMLPIKRSIRKALSLDYQVTMSISQFERDTNGEVVLNARWGLLTDEKEELILRRSIYKEMPESNDYGDLAAAQSRVLIQLSREIAETIKEFEEKR